jgi:tetratricopeptide (TPR) repeat protein
MWDEFYNIWLSEYGDSTTLLYLVHRQQYLRDGAVVSSQENINLNREIRAILKYSKDQSACRISVQAKLAEPRVEDYCTFLEVALPTEYVQQIRNIRGYNQQTISELLQSMDKLDLSISTCSKTMQRIPEAYWTHPIWILWCYIFDRNLSDSERYILVCYRYVFWYYFHREDYSRASQVYMLALDPQERCSELPLLSREVLRYIMLGEEHEHI